jgi:hypothetical protein
MLAPKSVYPKDEVLLALRELYSQHPGAVKSGPDKLVRMLHVRRFLPRRCEVGEVEAALEALRVEGEIEA